jgi:hypothetical protein
MAQISRSYTKFFYANLYKILRYFEKFCYLLYQYQQFSTDDIFYTQQRNFKTLIGGEGGTTVHPSTPTPSLLPVVNDISYTRNFVYFECFFCFLYNSKIHFLDPDSNFNKYLCKITIFPVFWET